MRLNRSNLAGLLSMAFLLAGSFFVASCGSAIRDEPRTRGMSVGSEQLTIGQQVFAQHCHQCHPGGAGGLAPAINDKPLPVWLMKTQVRAGLGAMPAFSKDHISDEQLDALMAYLKALRATGSTSETKRSAVSRADRTADKTIGG
jgi:mono/diheme cytochrome c family protein